VQEDNALNDVMIASTLPKQPDRELIGNVLVEVVDSYLHRNK